MQTHEIPSGMLHYQGNRVKSINIKPDKSIILVFANLALQVIWYILMDYYYYDFSLSLTPKRFQGGSSQSPEYNKEEISNGGGGSPIKYSKYHRQR